MWGTQMGDQMGEGIEEWVGAGGRGHHQRHGEQHGDDAGEEGEEGAEPEVGGLHAVMVVAVVVVGFAWSGGQGGVVAGVADGGDERVGVDGRSGGDLRGVRHEVDAGRGNAGDRF